MSGLPRWERLRPFIEDDPDGERIPLEVLAKIIRIEGVPIEFGPFVAKRINPERKRRGAPTKTKRQLEVELHGFLYFAECVRERQKLHRSRGTRAPFVTALAEISKETGLAWDTPRKFYDERRKWRRLIYTK